MGEGVGTREVWRGLHQEKKTDEKIKGYDGLVGWKKEDMCVGVLVGRLYFGIQFLLTHKSAIAIFTIKNNLFLNEKDNIFLLGKLRSQQV